MRLEEVCVGPGQTVPAAVMGELESRFLPKAGQCSTNLSSVTQ